MTENADGRRWWHGAVIYQLYVRSWRDSNDDGYGDLRGIIERLDYLSQLGVDAVWLSPTMPSPDDDWGYDVSDYTGVHPELGTLADLDELIDQAGQRGIRAQGLEAGSASPLRAGLPSQGCLGRIKRLLIDDGRVLAGIVLALVRNLPKVEAAREQVE